MRGFYDLNVGKLVLAAGYTGVLERVEIKRGDTSRMEMEFSRLGLAEMLAGTLEEMVFVAKSDFLESSDPLLLANDWTLDEETMIYSSPLGADLSALEALLGAAEFVDIKGELSFTTSTLGTASSQTVVVRVFNDVWKGTEGTPLSLTTPDEWLEARRPAPITRTAAQGPPQPGHLMSFTYADEDNPERGGDYEYLGIYEAFGNIVYTRTDATLDITDNILSGAGYYFEQELGVGGSWAMKHAGDLPSESPSTYMIGSAADDPAAVPDYMEVQNETCSPVFTALVYGGGTAATALDQACIVGDAGKNKLLYRCVQLTPTRWQLATANVIPDSDNPGEFIQLTWLDGAFTPVAYSLS